MTGTGFARSLPRNPTRENRIEKKLRRRTENHAPDETLPLSFALVPSSRNGYEMFLLRLSSLLTSSTSVNHPRTLLLTRNHSQRSSRILRQQ